MTTEERIEIEINTITYERDRTRKRLGGLYRFIKLVFTIITEDLRQVFRGFFPAFGTNQFLDLHIRALQLPDIPSEQEESKQNRLKNAQKSIMYLGTRKSLNDFMNTNKFSRLWSIIEFPKDAFTIGALPFGTPIGLGKMMIGEGLYIYVKDLTDAQKILIENYIGLNTPPDVGVIIYKEA